MGVALGNRLGINAKQHRETSPQAAARLGKMVIKTPTDDVIAYAAIFYLAAGHG